MYINPEDSSYAILLYDIIRNRINDSLVYDEDVKKIMCKIMNFAKDNDLYLYTIEIWETKLFDFEIKNFKKIKKYLVNEFKDEIINQALIHYKDYEDVSWQELSKWFRGLGIDITLLSYIDKRFSDHDIRIIY